MQHIKQLVFMLSVYKVYSLIHIDIGQPDTKFGDQIVNSFGRLKISIVKLILFDNQMKHLFAIGDLYIS